jgi:hypothetical protein
VKIPKKLRKMKAKTWLLFFLTNLMFAQQFKSTAALSKIKTDGLHSIAISPSIRSFSKVDLSDLRLFDNENKEVPFYVWNQSMTETEINFKALPIVSKEILANKFSTFIIENTENKTIDEIVLNIANTNLTKILNISGSNNQNEWFGLVEKHKISDLENNLETNVFIAIKIPKSTYKYLKIEINDKKNSPINLLKLGIYKKSSPKENLLFVKPISIKNNTINDRKLTQINIDFKEKQVVESIDFKITNPKYFKRTARILVNKTIVKKHNKKENYQEIVTEFELSSNQINKFSIPTIFEKEIIIEIDNQDNQPLEIKDLQFAQIPIFLVAELNSNKEYSLKTGNPLLDSPNYDIYNFKDGSISTLPKAHLSELKKIETESFSQTKNDLFWQKKWFLFLCIGFVGIVILFFSVSLLKEIK